jgi:hypothetical protein
LVARGGSVEASTEAELLTSGGGEGVAAELRWRGQLLRVGIRVLFLFLFEVFVPGSCRCMQVMCRASRLT